MKRLALLLLLLSAVVACSAELETSTPSPVDVDEALPPPGVPDRGRDPAVVALLGAASSLCSGVLIARDVVLTARGCATPPLAPGCAGSGLVAVDPASPAAVRVLVSSGAGPPVEHARARTVVTPDDCSTDLAALVLDAPIAGIAPAVVAGVAPAIGDRVRAVAFGADPSAPGNAIEIVRDHLLVSSSSATSLTLDEACREGAGGPAIDEDSAEIVAVASGAAGAGGGDTCVGEVYTRLDASASFVAEALGASAVPRSSAAGDAKPEKGAIDVGAGCVSGAGCAAGVCVLSGGAGYCSRTCGGGDRCPAHHRCAPAPPVAGGSGAGGACVAD